MALSYVSVVLDMFNGQGVVVPGGAATFTPSAVLTDVTDGQVIAAQPLTVQLAGAVPNAVLLLATDNSAPQPAGWTWGASFTGPGAPVPFSFFLPAGPATFTVTGSSATLTWTAGGGITELPVGTGVQLSGGSLPGNFTPDTTYYVVTSSGFTVELSGTPGGSPVTSSGSGSGSLTIVQSRLSALTPVQSSVPMSSYLTSPSGTPANGDTIVATGPGSWDWSSAVVSNPMTAGGDIVYGGALGSPARLAGNPATAREFLTSQGTGSAAQAPAWNSIQPSDVPILNQSTTGNAATATTLSGTVALANGGTGQTSQQAALDTLAGSQTAGDYLRGNGSHVQMSGIQAADVPTLNQSTTGNAATATNLASGATLPGYLAPKAVALTFGTTIAVNAAAGNAFNLTLTASTGTISNPTNPVDGQVIRFRISQDATGSRTVAWGTAYDFGSGSAPTLSTSASKVDIIAFEYIASLSKWACLNTGGTGY